MISIFFDTHFNDIVIALYKDEVLFDKVIVSESLNHSTIFMPTFVSFLESHSLKPQDINDIVVVIGPGSFTGVRIGVTIAKMLSYVLNIPIRSITSLEMYLPVSGNFENISIPEKNGYFVGELDSLKQQIIKYSYYNKEDYVTLKTHHTVLENPVLSYESMMRNAHLKKPISCHEVNPFYVKEIEALK